MSQFSDILLDGFVEEVGQELKPFASAGTSPLSPMRPQDGHWAFRFNEADLTRISVFVKVNFGAPFSLTADLFSEMNEAQVENLTNWLTRVLETMRQNT